MPVPRDAAARFRHAIPFGLGSTKPHHFRDMLQVAWDNRDNLPYAWQILSRGVCDGCALGVAGLHDWTIPGVHLCMTRLNLLRLNTAPPLDLSLLDNVAALRRLHPDALRKLGRLPVPLLRQRGDRGFRRISWDDALTRIAARIQRSDPKRLAFYVTARGVTNEVYYAAQKVARFLGTNHVDNAARLCHAPSTGAMKRTLGVAASTCSYKDWFGTDLIVFFGSNPANDQPVAIKYLLEAKRMGTQVALVNPYLEPGMDRYWVPSSASSALFGTDIADHWFPVAQGGDIAFLYGVAKVLLARGWFDSEFIGRHCANFDAFRRQAEGLAFPVLVQASGLSQERMEHFAELLHRAPRAVFVWSMGITQHTCGADAVQMILNIGLLRRYVGRDLCGLMPIRGHSSVQGGAEMGAYATALPGGLPITDESCAHLGRQYGFPIPTWPGYTAPDMVEAAARGHLDILYSVGGNFVRTLPDPDFVQRALERVPLRVHQDIVLSDPMLLDPAEEVIVLPAKTRYEQDGGGIETTTERRIAFTPELPRQLGEARAEWQILRDIARRARPEAAAQLGLESGPDIRREIARVIPFYEGVQHLKQTGDSIQYGGRHLCGAEGQFPTPDGRAHFFAPDLPRTPSEPGLFKVSTRRGKQFNNLIYAAIDPLTGAPRDAVLIHPDDASLHRLLPGDPVVLESESGSFQGRVFVAPIARNNLQVHWPEGNTLLARDAREPVSDVPDYNAWVRIKRLPPTD